MTRFKYIIITLCCLIATSGVKAKEDKFKYSLDKFYEYKTRGTSYKIYETREDAINKSPSFQSGYGECRMIYLGKDYTKIPVSFGPGRFQKVKVLNCPSNRSGEGKKGYYYGFWGGVYYEKPKKYDNELSRIFKLATKKRHLEVLSKLKTDFTHHSISKLAATTYERIVKENQMIAERKRKEEEIIAEKKRKGKSKAIQEIKEEYESSIYLQNSMLNIAQSWKNNEVFRYVDSEPVYYKDGITNGDYNRLVESIFDSYIKVNSIKSIEEFIKQFPEHYSVKDAEYEIYKIVKQQNNIAGFNWFIKNYPNSRDAKKALSNMHNLAFELSKNINTINSYNDFIIAYPTAKQVTEIQERAYDLEKSEFVGILSFFNEEKDARRLLIQSKILEQSSEDLPREQRTGYMMVVNRMNDLLKHEFNSTDAALRHLESNEFKSFVKTFKTSMRDLKRQVARIADNTDDLSTIMENQSNMMNNHFENAAQDREMASELTKQHRFWERYLGEVGY